MLYSDNSCGSNDGLITMSIAFTKNTPPRIGSAAVARLQYKCFQNGDKNLIPVLKHRIFLYQMLMLAIFCMITL